MSPHRRTFFVTLLALTLILSVVSMALFPSSVGHMARNPNFELTAKEKELLKEINLLRADPPKYALFLAQSKKYYKGKDYKPPGQAVSLTTIEGVAAVDEAIKVLRATKPLPQYSMSPGMCSAAKDHVNDIGKSGRTGHKGTDGSTTEARVNRYGRYSSGVGENIIYESLSARDIVIGWVVDDGVANRGHRRNLLSPDYRYIGLAVGNWGDHNEMCVITLAGEYVEKTTSPATGKPKPSRKMK